MVSTRPRPPVLVAPDSFKGSFRAAEVAAAIGRGLDSAAWPVDLCPIADGGEGTMEVLLTALGGETSAARVHDPLGREVTAGFGLVEDGSTAIVEMAQASGLGLVAEDERDPVAASTAGTGELILAAVREGAEVVLVAVGGSATTDGGAGAIAAIRDGGGMADAKLVVLCDVRTPFERAAQLFAAQKGADPAAVEQLTRRLRQQAGQLPRDPSGVPMTGAAGGLAGGLWAALGARLEPGAVFVLDACGFDSRLRASRAVVTGEGSLDPQSMEGKAVGEVCVRARQAGVPAHAIVGTRSLDDFEARILDLQTIEEAGTSEAIESAARRLAESL